MSVSDSSKSVTVFRWALTVLAVGATTTAVAIVAPLANLDRVDARSSRSFGTEVVAVGTGTARSTAMSEAWRWTARPSILLVSAAPAAPVATTPSDVVIDDILSLRYVRLEAIARAAAKLRAEQEAAAAAAASAAAAAAQAAEHAAAQAAAASAARAAQGFVQRVWTSGFQNEINQCRGAVDVTGVYQLRVIAEHSNCGGSRFPTAPGAIVTITGLDAGRYRVIGVVAHLNGNVNRAEDIPRGYDLLFQTCASGYTDMRFTALERIG